MAGKSRRRGRHLPQVNKKKKVSRGVKAPLASAPVAAAEPSSTPPRVEARPPAAKAPASRAATARPLNVAGELRRIGLMGGSMVAILVLLYFFLP